MRLKGHAGTRGGKETRREGDQGDAQKSSRGAERRVTTEGVDCEKCEISGGR